MPAIVGMHWLSGAGDLARRSEEGVTSEFDTAVAVQPVGPGRLRGEVKAGWDVAGVPNGGYVLALAVGALRTAVDGPDPLTVTAHYLAPAREGPVEIDVTTVRRGSGHSTAVATMRQRERPFLAVLGTFGSLPDAAEPAYQRAQPPELPPLEESVRPIGTSAFEVPALTERVELRLHPAQVGFALGTPHGTAEVSGWLRLADGRQPDTAALPLFADVFPPAAYNSGVPMGWAATVELTVHVRARPAPGWLRGRFVTRLITGGYFEEDGELWDADGRLVALSRQLGVAREGPPASQR